MNPNVSNSMLVTNSYSLPLKFLNFEHRAAINLELFKKAVLIATIISKRTVKLVLVDPRNTSRLHNNCGGTLNRGSTSYDYAPCKKCNAKVNTHINAAKNIVQKGENIINNNNSPSTHVRRVGAVPLNTV